MSKQPNKCDICEESIGVGSGGGYKLKRVGFVICNLCWEDIVDLVIYKRNKRRKDLGKT